jgi:hypothetical protein
LANLVADQFLEKNIMRLQLKRLNHIEKQFPKFTRHAADLEADPWAQIEVALLLVPEKVLLARVRLARVLRVHRAN